MSKYTTEVRFICETYAGLEESKGYADISSIIEKARTKVFDFDFPIYDESYRSVLETKILNHYYTREIGFETVGLWKHFLNMRLNEIMPYYNQLYKSTLYEFNPLYDVDLTTTSNRDIKHDETTGSHNTRTDDLTQTSSDTATRTDDLAHTDHTTTSNSSKERYSDTPQGGLDGMESIESNLYLTNATLTDESGESNNNGTDTGTVKSEGNGSIKNTGTQKDDGSGTRNYTNTDGYLEHVIGKSGGSSYSNRILEYRKTFLNIDMDIIEDLSDLFLNLW